MNYIMIPDLLIFQRVFGFDLGLEQMMDDVRRSLHEEWQYKSESLSRAIEPITSLVDEMTRPLFRAMRNMYNRDAFYIRTTANHISMWATRVGYVIKHFSILLITMDIFPSHDKSHDQAIELI